MSVDMVLYIVAAICFALAALGVTVHPRVSLIAAGLFFWVLTNLL